MESIKPKVVVIYTPPFLPLYYVGHSRSVCKPEYKK